MNKQFMYGLLAGVAAIWVLKNAPVVSPITAPHLAKLGL